MYNNWSVECGEWSRIYIYNQYKRHELYPTKMNRNIRVCPWGEYAFGRIVYGVNVQYEWEPKGENSVKLHGNQYINANRITLQISFFFLVSLSVWFIFFRQIAFRTVDKRIYIWENTPADICYLLTQNKITPIGVHGFDCSVSQHGDQIPAQNMLCICFW